MKNWLWKLSGLLAFIGFPICDATAQSYPIKPVRLIVGFSSGSAVDVVARLVSQKLSDHLRQAIIVENITGASGLIAAERVVRSSPDGYTLLMVTATDAAQPALQAKLTFDLERDFTPIGIVAIGKNLLAVHPSLPVRNVKDLIALARSRPGELSFGSSGVGATSHLSGEMFKSMAKVDIIHVPFRGSSASVVATSTGQISMSFPSITGALPLLSAGRLKALAVTSLKRASLLPSIPTIDESGLRGYDSTSWFGFSAPAGTPRQVIESMSMAINDVLRMPMMIDALSKQGLELNIVTPEQFSAFIHNAVIKNMDLVKAIGLKPH